MIASQPHRDAGRGEIGLRLGDAVKAEMEDRGGEHGGGVAVADAGDEVGERADAAGGDDGDRHRVRHRACQVDIEARFGAVAVHRGQQDLAGAERSHAARPDDGVEPGRAPSAMGEHLPALRGGPLGVDRDHDALAAEFLGRLADEVRTLDRRGIDRHLVGAGEEQAADVLDDAHAAADGERHEALLGGPPDDVVERRAFLVARRDVEKAELVGALAVVEPRLLDGIAGIDEIDEVDALDDAAVLDVETGDQALLQHARFSACPGASPRSRASAARASMPTTMRPGWARQARLTRSGSRNATVPRMTRRMPRSSQLAIPASSRIPPPNWTGSVVAATIASTAAAFRGLPAKAPSRSTTCSHSKPAAAKARA